MDIWETIPGDSIAESLHRALQNSRNGILVATPEARESGWVKDEYTAMIARKRENPDFRIIPVIYGDEIPDFPFINDIYRVDFRHTQNDRRAYKESFYRLVCGLDGKVPGADACLLNELEYPGAKCNRSGMLPSPNEDRFLNELFEMLHTKRAIILLAQEDRGQGRLVPGLMERAEKRFDRKNVFHVGPPYGRDVDLADFFATLAMQLNLGKTEINSSISFQQALERKLANGNGLFMMVSGFENASSTGQEQLAGIFRALNERYPHMFRIVISGGEKLADLYYTGALSFLSHAEVKEMPELTPYGKKIRTRVIPCKINGLNGKNG